MSNPDSNADPLAGASRQEIHSAHFASLVMQNVNVAMLCLGKAPHPETGETKQDLDAAQHFIDQLEMLEAKTKGNLDKREEGLLKQSLTTLRMAFVEAAEGASPAPPAAPTTTPPPSASSEPLTTGTDAEAHKKFTKKY
jgi:hypothetical protein